MKALLLGLTLCSCAFCTGCAFRTNRTNAHDSTTQAPEIISKTNIEVGRVEIIYFPERIETFQNMSPEELERQWFFKLSVKDLPTSPVRKELDSAIETSKFIKTEEEGDLRWGCFFYDSNEDRIMTFFFDRTGRVGVVNGVRVRSDGKLVKALGRICAGFRR